MNDTPPNDTPPNEPTAAEPSARSARSLAVSIAAGVLGVLAVVGLLASTIAVWAKRTLSDTDTFASIADNVLQDPQVIDAASIRITDELFVALDVEARVEELLPPALGSLGSVLVSSAESVVQDQVGKVLALDGTRQLLVEAVRRSHALVLDILRGEALPPSVAVDDDQVRLNALPAYSRILTWLQDRTGLFSGVDVPQFEPGGDPQDQIAELEDVFGRDLPDDFGQIVLYEGDAVAQASGWVELARDLVVTVNRWIWALLALTVVLFAASVVLARRTSRAVLFLAGGSALALLLARWVTAQIVDRIPESVASVGARTTVEIAATELTSGLRFTTGLLLVIAVGVTVATWWVSRRERDVA